MRVLIVKMTSLGDVIHTLPALTDAAKAHPNIEFDWVVEKPFAEIPSWHAHVKRVIPVALRQWRKAPFSKATREAFRTFVKDIRQNSYDLIIDPQGLLKSAGVACLARGKRVGFAKPCAREPLASLFYNTRIQVDPKAHAIDRVRALFAEALGYTFDPNTINYGMTQVPKRYDFKLKTILLLHGTTWPTKHWPDDQWRALAERFTQAGMAVKCVWGNEAEKSRADMICQNLPEAGVMPKLTLSEIASLLHAVDAVVAVDTGIGHLAAALHKPTVSIYGPTNPALTGTRGPNQVHVQEMLPCTPCMQEQCTHPDLKRLHKTPCMAKVLPETIFKHIEQVLA